jgi:cullin-associated NEDD8-dissociated protein 1
MKLEFLSKSIFTFSFSRVQGEAVPILASFLRKNQRALKLSTLLLLDTLVKNNYAQALSVQALQTVSQPLFTFSS